MQLLNETSTLPGPPIRSLAEGPNYSVSWRWEVVEQYLGLSRGEDKQGQFDQILGTEKDPYIRQLLKFQHGRRCVIFGPIQYSVRCQVSNGDNRIASLIKAMTVARLSATEIGQQLGADALNITAFQKIFFDVVRYLHNGVWLGRLCHPVLRNPSAAEESEARWLGIAFDRGWPGLAPNVSQSGRSILPTGKSGWDGLLQLLLFRSVDYIRSLERRGVRPNERDLQLLAILQHRMEGLGIQLTLRDLDFAEPVDAEQRRSQAEADQAIKGLPPEQRRRIVALVNTVLGKADSDRPAAVASGTGIAKKLS